LLRVSRKESIFFLTPGRRHLWTRGYELLILSEPARGR